jgi:RNA polymerase sigma factor for flagellar operon FliA
MPELGALALQEAGLRRHSSEERDAQVLADRRTAESALWHRHIKEHDLEAREALIMLHLPYAKAVAGGLYAKHVNHETDFEEYVQWATLGMIEALDRYDPARGAQFRTYAHVRMLGAIRNGLEHISERQEQLSLHRKLVAERVAAAKGSSSLGSGAQDNNALMNAMAEISASMMLSFMLDDTGMLQSEDRMLPDGSYESILFKQEQQRVRDLIDLLTPREQSVIRLHYLQGLTYEDIARTLGITRGRVSQLHEQALGRMRRLVAPASEAKPVKTA